MFKMTVWMALAMCLLGVVWVSGTHDNSRTPVMLAQSVAVSGTVIPVEASRIVTPTRKVMDLSAPIRTTPLSDVRTLTVLEHTAGTSQPALPQDRDFPAGPIPLITLVGFISLGIAITLVLFRDHAEARSRASSRNDR